MQNNKNVTVELIFIRVISKIDHQHLCLLIQITPRIDCYVLCCSHSLTLCCLVIVFVLLLCECRLDPL